MSRNPASHNMYRINAVRGLAGRRPVMPKLHSGVGGAIAQIDFAVPEYKAPEDIGELEITLLKTGGDSDVRVIVETQDGSAKAGVKYKALKHYAIDFEGENAPGEA